MKNQPPRRPSNHFHITYTETKDGWVWEFLNPSGFILARSPQAYTYRWTSRRSAQAMLDGIRNNAVYEDGDPNGRDYPFERASPKKKKPAVGGEADLIDRSEK